MNTAVNAECMPSSYKAGASSANRPMEASAARPVRERWPARRPAAGFRELERELRRKEKALAEAAALLVLRKKADAIWGTDEAV